MPHHPSPKKRRFRRTGIAAAVAALLAMSAASAGAVTLGGGTPPPSNQYGITVTKTASTSYVRTYDWTITKTAAPTTITTPATTATVGYTVVVTKGAPVDSGFTVSGTITVSNSGYTDVTGVAVTDETAPSTPCALTGADNLTIPAGKSVDIPYSCPLPAMVDGTNQATATWNGGTASGQAPYAFGAPTSVVNDTVSVTDSFNNGAPILLPGGAGISAGATFTYSRDVPVPAVGCTPYPNVATITSAGQIVKQASAQVSVCNVAILTGVPGAIIKVKKTGPAKASAGQVVTYTIVLRNTSTQGATSVVLRDVLPAGYSFYKTPKGASLAKGKLVWNVGDFAAGAKKTVKVRVKVGAAVTGTRCNTAVASAANAATARSKACTKILAVAGVSLVPSVTG
jgi:uncharacterized repeat protein (TIGR01451 family)